MMFDDRDRGDTILEFLCINHLYDLFHGVHISNIILLKPGVAVLRSADRVRVVGVLRLAAPYSGVS